MINASPEKEDSLLSIYIRLSSYNSSNNYNIKDFLNRSLSRLRELSRIIRESDLRALIRLVIEIKVYFYLYFAISS